MNELEIFAILRPYLIKSNLTWYAEVPGAIYSNHYTIDVVVTNRSRICTIELKKSLTKKSVYQAKRNLNHTSDSWILVSTSPRRSSVNWINCKNNGIGIATVKNGFVEVLLKRNIGKDRLYPKFKLATYLGKVHGFPGSPSPRKDFYLRLITGIDREEYINLNWQSLFKSVPNLYPSITAMKMAIRNMDRLLYERIEASQD